MTTNSGPGAWLGFLNEYLRKIPSDPAGVAAYQLFTYFRDAGPAMWIKDPLKALYFTWLSRTGESLARVPLLARYDYAFVVDGTAAPGLMTSLPVLRALPPGRSALILARDRVFQDPRFREFLGLSRFTVLNLDRIRPSGPVLPRVLSETFKLARSYPRALPAVAKLTQRRLHCAALYSEIFRRTTIGTLVVSNERHIVSCAALQAAKLVGTRTVCLQHGALVDQYLPVTVDRYMTWGGHSSEWFRKRGVNARLSDLGAPRTDAVVSVQSPPSEGPSRETVVAFFSQPPGADMESARYHRVEKEFLSLLEEPRCALWVKPHPADPRGRWEALARGHPGRLKIIDPARDAYQVIREADFVGAFYSSVLVEAMLFAKPVFQLNPFGDDVPDYSRDGGCAPIADGPALRQWVLRCLTDASFRDTCLARQRDFIRGYFSNLGCASPMFYRTLDAVP